MKPCPHCKGEIDASLFYGGSGRRPACTPEIAEKIYHSIETTGCSAETAGMAEGVSDRTVWNWLARGREGKEPYSAFFQGVARSRAKWQIAALRKLEDIEAFVQNVSAASASSNAIKWKLERLLRDQFGEVVVVKVRETKDHLMQTLLGVCDKMGENDNRVRPAEVFSALLQELEGHSAEVPAADRDSFGPN